MEQLLFNFKVSSAATLTQGLNPAQTQAVEAPLQSAVRVMAGAGTGKTELITRRFVKLVLELMEEGTVDPAEKIWVSTFTEKAAQEMRTRITQKLGDALNLTLNSHAWIGTFHGLCLRILQEHAALLGKKNGRTILNDVELKLFQEPFIENLLLEDWSLLETVLEKNSFTFNMNAVSRAALMALETDEYDALFTQIITQLIPRMKAAGWTPQQFRNQAIAQTTAFAQLIDTMPGYTDSIDSVESQHYYYASAWEHHLRPVAHHTFSFEPSDWTHEIHVLKEIAANKSAPSKRKILKDNIKKLYEKQCWVGYNGKDKKSPFSPPLENLNNHSQALQQELALIDLVTACYLMYQETMAQQGLCDYDDLILETIDLFEKHPNIALQYQEKFAHFMVDEFQDSNGAQLRLLQCLMGDLPARLTAVGDTKQSIYGFRFAQPENLDLLFQPYARVESIALNTNYRSVPPVLAVANHITRFLDAPAEAQLQPRPEHAQCDAHPVHWFHIADKLPIDEARGWEVRWIVESIAKLLDGGGIAPQSIAILVRDHAKAALIENALDAIAIPSIKQKNIGFFNPPVIRQAISWLELAFDPHQDQHVINLLQPKLSHYQLYQLADVKKSLKISYFETCRQLVEGMIPIPKSLENTIPALAFFVRTLETLHKRAWPPADYFAWILQNVPLLTTSDKQTRAGKRLLRQLTLLQNMITYWSERPNRTLTLEETLIRVRRSQAENVLGDVPMRAEGWPEAWMDEAAVRILTVHASKGLEFPIVFLAGVSAYQTPSIKGVMHFDPQYPGKLGTGLMLNKFNGEDTHKKLIYQTVWHKPRAEAEALRLFYVGVTRARDQLFISSGAKGFGFMNPALFEGQPIELENIDTVDWQPNSDYTRWRTIFSHRFDARDVDGNDSEGYSYDP